MSILAELDKLEKSAIYKLKYGESILGLRVKIYSIEEKGYHYFDFEKSYVKRKDLREYLSSHSKEFETLILMENNGLLCTQDEIKRGILIQEFKDEKKAEDVLELVITIMKGKETSSYS